MNAHFATPAAIDLLEASAASWVGTPFWENSAVKGPGGGVSCHFLVSEIMFETGMVRFDVPRGAGAWSNGSKRSIIEPYLDAAAWAMQLNQPGQPIPIGALLPGDILGFRIGGCLHHVALLLRGDRFVHCLRGPGVHVSLLADSSFLVDKSGQPRLVRAWRPTDATSTRQASPAPSS